MSYGTVQAEKMTTESGYSLGAGNASSFKNRIINGGMVIDQRNNGASVTPTATGYTLDRWQATLSQASKFSVQQNAGSATPPVGFTNYLGVTSTSAYSVLTGDFFDVRQYIEGFNCADLGWGTANAKTVTISFWVRSSLTGTFGGSLRNSGGARSYPFSYTISSANTWEQKSIAIAGDTSGTWLTNNGTGIILTFALGAGSTYSSTANSWQAGNFLSATGATSVVGTNGATFYITGVQLEVGSTATSFDYRPYSQELALCQRYCYALRSADANGNYMRYALGDAVTSNATNHFFYPPVTFRSTVSLTTTGTASNYEIYSAGAETVLNAVPSLSGDGNTPYVVIINGSVASGLTAGRAAQLMSNNNKTSFLIMSAEL